jgi:hypothetical protein
MQPLRIRKPRAPKGTRRFTKAAKPVVRKRAAGPWPPRHVVYFETLRRYVRRERHAHVPYEHREAGVALGLWVSLRRRDYRLERLTPEQIRILEALPAWTWHPIADQFPRGLAAIESFADREGHTRVPRGHVEKGVRLDLWASNRRADRRKGKLSRNQIRALDRVSGWTWSLRDSWFETGFAHLLRFVKREGHACPPAKHVEDGFRLGGWVSHLRSRRRELSKDRRKTLEAFPAWSWSLRK